MRKIHNDELGRITPNEFKKTQKTPLTLVLDDIRSLHNIGSIFRTADAFLVKKIFLCGISATPPNKEIHKTALGATESVDWEYEKTVTGALNRLRADKISIYAVEQVEGAVMLNDFKAQPQAEYALVFGNEVFGVSAQALELCHGSIEIPQAGTKHSLNVSVSAGLVVWEFYRQLSAPA